MAEGRQAGRPRRRHARRRRSRGLAECGWDAESVEAALDAAARSAGFVNAEGRPQLAKAQAPVRVAITGRAVGPPLFESLVVLGRERTLERLRVARSRL